MNPLLSQALGSIVRWLLAIAAGALVQHGVWSQSDADKYVTAAALAILSLLWSLWQKYKSRVHFLTALELPGGTSEETVKEHVDTGRGVLPVILLAVALGAGALTVSGCAGQAPPSVSPTVYAAAQILQRVDELQNAVISTNRLTPGAIPDVIALPIVRFCVESAKVLKDAPNGVLPAIAAEWRRVKADVPTKYRQMPSVAAAFIAIDVALAEVGQ